MRVLVPLLAGTLAACFSRPVFESSDAPRGDAGDDAPDSMPVEDYNIVFVTSDAKKPSLLFSLANADAWCATNAVGLPPNTYRAWISAEGVVAPERLGDAVGFVRPDGKPIANTVATLLDGKHWYPPRLDENQNDVMVPNPDIFTGTTHNGGLFNNCGELSNNGLNYLFGNADCGSFLWTEFSQHSCNQTARIYCVGTDHRNAVTQTRDPSLRLAFISAGKTGLNSTTGIDALDELCQSEADAAQVSGTFRAAASVAGQSIKDRFPDGPAWARKDGVVVLTPQMTAMPAALWLDVNAQAIVGLPDAGVVWTGATSFVDNVKPADNCNDWKSTNSGETAIIGYAPRSRLPSAVNDGTKTCNTQQRVYCLQM